MATLMTLRVLLVTLTGGCEPRHDVAERILCMMSNQGGQVQHIVNVKQGMQRDNQRYAPS